MKSPLDPRAPGRVPVPPFLLLVLLAAPGCLMQPSFSAKTTTADGVLIEVPLTMSPPVIKDDAITVNKVVFTPWTVDKEKNIKGLALAFQLAFAKGQKPVSVQVDDVSDEPILNVFNDPKPVLTDKAHWNAVTVPHNPADEYAKWMLNLDNTIKVYRFTVKMADGSTHVLRYPIYVPSNMKAFMRSQLGVTT
jgi:hypothetical protein